MTFIPDMKRVNDTPPGTIIIGLIHGAKGSGKTWYAATAGNRSVHITINASNTGIETLRSKLFKEKVGTDPFHIPLYQELGDDKLPIDKAKLFDDICRTIDWLFINKYDDFDTIVIDDVTSMKKAAMFKGFVISSQEGLSEALTRVGKHIVPLPGIQDYGQEMKIMQWFMDTYIPIFRKENKNLLLLAHQRITYEKARNNQGGILVGAPDVIDKVRPGFTGKSFPDDIIADIDEVWHMEKVGSGKDAQHRLRIYGDEQILCSTRHPGSFNNLEINPNFLEMWNRIKTEAPPSNPLKKR